MKRFASVVLALAVALLAAPPPSGAGEGFQVIVNGRNPVSSLSRDLLSKIFLKKVQKWDNGWAASPVDQDQSSATRAAFSKAVHGKPVTAVASYWQRQIFAGNDVPPAEKADDAAVIAFVKSSPGAIGYVSGNAPSDVKVVAVE
jgi:ABC-type phosphate transport system substrate-binding protein